MDESIKLPLRCADWQLDRAGMDAEGFLVIMDPNSADPLCRRAKVAEWYSAMDRVDELVDEVARLRRQLNAAAPGNAMAGVIAEMEKRGAEADALRGEGPAGKVMCGQAQAYRDGAAMLRSKI